MRAVVLEEYGGPEVLQIREIPDPSPGREEVAIRVMATALNRADLLQRRGQYPQPKPRPAHEVPGLEYAGVVTAVGEQVTRFKAGDRVCGLVGGGGYAEAVISHERLVLPIPEHLSWEEAASVPEAFMTAYDALLLQANLRTGSKVLIHAGGSGVGTAAIQICRAVGATVFTTVGSEEKGSRTRELGADRVINYRTEDFRQVILDETGGEGVDIIIDFVGGSYLERNVDSLARRGRMVILGTLGGGNGAELPVRKVLMKWLTIMGSTIRSRTLEEKATLTQAFGREILPLFARGILRPVVDSVFPFDQVAAAHEYMEANRNFGKIVLSVE